MIKAELVQASINAKNGKIVYTFHLTYPVKSWLNIFRTLFENHCTQGEYITTTSNSGNIGNAFAIMHGMPVGGVLSGPVTKCAEYAYETLSKQVQERVALVDLVLLAVYRHTAYKITPDQARLAMDLFGERFQDVLKIYQVGDWHRPLALSSAHDRQATENGWE